MRITWAKARALAFILIVVAMAGVSAEAANPTTCTGGSFDPPNNGGTNSWPCAVSGNSGTITSLTLSTSVSVPFSVCYSEHSWTLVSPSATEHALGNLSGSQNTVIASAFDGEGSNGTWTLKETDRNGNDSCNGTLGNFTLTFTLASSVPPPTVSFNETSLSENGAPSFNVKVVTDDGNPTTATASVDVGLDGGFGGSAESGNDYNLTVTTLNIPSGTANNSLLPIGALIDDAALERPETIRLVFSNASGVTASSSHHDLTITDDESGSIHFSSASSSVNEFGSPTHSVPLEIDVTSGDGTGTVGANLFGNIVKTGGTATQGTYNAPCPNSDFSFYDDPVTFNGSDDWFLNASNSTWSPGIRVCDDSGTDVGETVILGITLSTTGMSNLAISGQTTHTVTITGETSVAVNDASAVEGNDVEFTISLSSPAPAGGVTVSYTTATGGPSPATVTTDFTPASGSAMIGAGETSAIVAISTAADTDVESDETFLLQLTDVSGSEFAISDSQGTGTITNDDTSFSAFLQSPNPANEGDGDGVTVFTVRVFRNGYRPAGQTIDVQTVAGTATGGGTDYTDLSLTTLTFTLNESFKDVTFDVIADEVDEADETLTFDLSNASGGAAISGDLTVTIVDDDNPTLAISDVTVNESDGTATFTVTQTGSTTFNASVDYSTSNQTAMAPDDYVFKNGTLNFSGANGETHDIVVTLVDDDLQESAETFRIFLSNATGADISDNQGVATINDNDVPSITINDVSASEGAGSATFTVSSGVRLQESRTITYDTVSGTAVAPDDFTAVSGGAVVIAAGSKQTVLNVTLVDDDLIEGAENFSVTITDAEGEAIADSSGVATILDDDGLRSDFDGDQDNDIIWRNYGDGRNAVWYMSGATRGGYGYFPDLAGNGWKLAGTGDWNDDGKPDLLWRNLTNGKNVIWYMNGLVRTHFSYMPTLGDLGWSVASVADFDGDGAVDDLLWRHSSTGENAIWYMTGASRYGFDYLLSVTDLGWKIGGAGDFDGDGDMDIVWRHSSTGKNVVWYMSGAMRDSYTYTLMLPDANWKMAGVADFNGDQKPDLLWRNTSTGANAFWYMSDTTRTGYDYLLDLDDQDWKVEGPR